MPIMVCFTGELCCLRSEKMPLSERDKYDRSHTEEELMRGRSLVIGLVGLRIAETLMRIFVSLSRRKKDESRKGWIHHVKVESRELYFLERKCFRVRRVAYAPVFIPVLGRYP